jgi:hypothetical protein
VRPAIVDQVHTRFQRVAAVRGNLAADQSTVDKIGLVGQARSGVPVTMLGQQPKQFRQAPGRLHPIVAQCGPNRRASLIGASGFLDRSGVIVHQPRRQRLDVAIDKQDGARCAVHRNTLNGRTGRQRD